MTFLSVAWQQIEVRQAMLRRSKTMNLQPAPSRLRRQGFPETLVLGLAPSVLALLVVSASCAERIFPHKPTPLSAQRRRSSNRPAPNRALLPHTLVLIRCKASPLRKR